MHLVAILILGRREYNSSTKTGLTDRATLPIIPLAVRFDRKAIWSVQLWIGSGSKFSITTRRVEARERVRECSRTCQTSAGVILWTNLR